ncbi:MAG: thioesterase family protein [Actinobacteria bacterium]|nr:thioesterase family protein [Actinomycetota bacterium]
MNSFEAGTAIEPVGDGRYRSHLHPGWRVVRGAHGGYISAIILRALTAEQGDEARTIRSYTTHFLSAPEEGPVDVVTATERTGRSMTSMSARLEQNGKTVAISLAAFSSARDGFSFDDAAMPEVGNPDDGFRVPTDGDEVPPFLKNFDMRWLIGGAPFSGSDKAEVGGWIRIEPPALADAPVVACLLDAWAPAIFPRATERVICPTVDLTMHFRSPLPQPGATADDYYLGRFWSKMSRDGFFEEDGELWSSDGTLLAQSRQLALALSR